MDIGELQDTHDAVSNVSEVQYFTKTNNEAGYVTLAHLEHSSGRSEWRTTIWDPDRIQKTTLGGQAIITQFPRLETDEVRVFERIASSDETRAEIPEDEFDQIETLTNDLMSPSTWQDDILRRQTGDSDVIVDIKQLCRQVAKGDSEVREEAKEILDLLNDHEMSDWAENQLRTIHRRRRRYGTKGTTRRLHHKLSEEIELVTPETVTEADVALSGQLIE